MSPPYLPLFKLSYLCMHTFYFIYIGYLPMVYNLFHRYSSGRTTGIVLDSGDGVTHAVPVFEGFSMPHAIRRVDIAGRDVTDHLQLLLRKAGHHLHTSAEREVVRTIKEKCCYIAANPAKEEKDNASRTEEFRLPDGNVIQLGPERFRAPEILFNPELIGQEYAGVHQVVVDSINRADLDLRKSLFSNIVLSGGSTLCKGKKTSSASLLISLE